MKSIKKVVIIPFDQYISLVNSESHNKTKSPTPSISENESCVGDNLISSSKQSHNSKPKATENLTGFGSRSSIDLPNENVSSGLKEKENYSLKPSIPHTNPPPVPASNIVQPFENQFSQENLLPPPPGIPQRKRKKPILTGWVD